MKAFLKTSCLTALLVSLLSFSLVSYRPQKQTPVNCLLIVGVAYKDFVCKRNDVDAVAFPTVMGSYTVFSNNSDDYYNNLNLTKKTLRKKYKALDKNMMIYSSEKPKAVIIQYKQNLSGWNCYVYKFIVGFGETEETALADAVKQKNDAVGESVKYELKGTVSCPE